MNKREVQLWIVGRFGFALLLIGILLLTSCAPKVGVGALRTESQSVELDGAEAVSVEIHYGAGDLKLTGGAEKLLEAGFNYNVASLKPEVEYADGRLVLRQPGTNGFPALQNITSFRNEWDLRLHDQVPMDLQVEVAFGSGELQLAGLPLTGLDLSLGVGQYTIDLSGDWARDLDVSIEAEAADLNILLPEAVGARVEIDSGRRLGVGQGLSREGDVLTNAAYGEAGVTLDIVVDAGISSINLEVEEASAPEAERKASTPHTASPRAQGPTDPAELEAFLDELLASQMEEYHIPGAAISVVKDGQLFFTKGYGYADLERVIPVDPEQTIFAIGSVGKVFTWTAVMQLVEQGKLDLDADINTYLDFRIPDTYPQPITLRHLLTHTSGFENRLLDSIVPDARDLVPAREWLISHMSRRVRPPGDTAGYANYNPMLAGYIVSRVSGQPYDQYIQEHILDPLGMAHSTAQSPAPPELRPFASVGYTYADGVFQPHPAFIAQPGVLPSGALQASVTDMARFMIMHLQDGRYSDETIGDRRILEESTAQQMQTTLFTHDPSLLGTAYGLFDFTDNGQRTLGHSGYAGYMNGLLLLLPDQDLGVYVIYNSMGGGDLTNQHLGFQRAFYDHYYPAPPSAPIQPPADFAERAGRFVGSYTYTMRSYTTADKVGALFSAINISDSGDGALLFNTPWGEWRFIEVEPLHFRRADGQFGMVFREDDRGRITHMFTDLTPQFAFEKLNWYETTAFNMALFMGSALIFLSMILVAAIRSLRGRLSGHQRPVSRGVRAASSIILGISVLNLVFIVGTLLWGIPVMLFGYSTIYKIVLGLGVLSAVLTCGALVTTALAWKNSYWNAAGRVYSTLVTIAAVAFVWFLNYWNLLGWRF